MADIVKGSVRIGEKVITFEGPPDFVTEQVARFTSDGELPVKCAVRTSRQASRRRGSVAAKASSSESSCSGRMLALRDDGFFAAQRSISEIRMELAKHGWHYPLTTLSGRLQALVQRRHLRREKVKDGRKKAWRYSNA